MPSTKKSELLLGPIFSATDRAMIAAAVREASDAAEEPGKSILADLAKKLSSYDSPLVSTSYVVWSLELLKKLGEMQPGDILDHSWGYVRCGDDGFMLAQPGEAGAMGDWVGDAARCAHKMYDFYLTSVGTK